MVAGETLSETQSWFGTTAELAPVCVARKEEGVGDLSSELPGDVHELYQANDRWAGNRQRRTPHDSPVIRFDDFRLTINDQSERPPHGNEGERLKRCIERQATHETPLLTTEIAPRSNDNGRRREGP